FSLFFFQAEDGIRDFHVTGVQTCALPICLEIGREGVVVVAGGGLRGPAEPAAVVADAAVPGGQQGALLALPGVAVQRVAVDQHRSEERRVGKECKTAGSTNRY